MSNLENIKLEENAFERLYEELDSDSVIAEEIAKDYSIDNSRAFNNEDLKRVFEYILKEDYENAVIDPINTALAYRHGYEFEGKTK